MEIEIKMSANLLKVTQPVVCIPLKFEEYQEYMKSKGFHWYIIHYFEKFWLETEISFFSVKYNKINS